MENFEYVMSILMMVTIFILGIRVWMTIASRIGESIGISKFIEWIIDKVLVLLSKKGGV